MMRTTLKNLSLALLCGVLAWMGVPAALAQQSLPLNLVVRNTDPVPGFAGETWLAGANAFQTPSIDLAGNVAFRASLATSTNISTSNDNGYWYGNAGTLVNQIQEGGPVLPGTTGTTYTSLQTNNVAMSPNGHMWIGGAVSGDVISSTNDQVIWTGTAGAMAKLYQEGDALPGVAGSIQSPASTSSSNNRLNNAGQTVVNGTIVGGEPATGNGGLFVGSPGNLGVVLQNGQGHVAFPGGELISGGSASALNGSGTVQISARVSGPDATAFTLLNGDNSGALSLVARTGTPTGIAGIEYGAAVTRPIFGLTSTLTTTRQGLNNNGRNIYGGSALAGAAISTGVNDEALFTHLAGTTSIIAQKGSPAPGVGSGVILSNVAGSFTSAYLNNNDQVAWLAQMSGTGVTTANDMALWQTQIGVGDTLVVREGAAVDGLADTFFGAPTNVIMNNLGQIVFNSTLTGAAVTSSTDWSAWAWDPTDGLFLVAREGSTYFGYTAGNAGFDTSGNGEGGSVALSDNGFLAFRLPGSSTQQSIVVAQLPNAVPEPSTMALVSLAGIGGVMFMRRRRS